MRKLRSKLERASSDWRYIHTHFGIGYRFSAEPVEEPVGEALPVPEPVEPVVVRRAGGGAAVPDLVRAG